MNTYRFDFKGHAPIFIKAADEAQARWLYAQWYGLKGLILVNVSLR